MKLSASIITKSLLAVLIGVGLFTSDVQAQDSPSITITIPFAFSANSQNNIPAGTYQMRLISEWLLSIRNLNSKGEQMFIVRPEQARSSGSHGCLIFDQFKGRNYLAEIHLTNSRFYTELIRRYRASTPKAKTCSSGDSGRKTVAEQHGPASKQGDIETQ